MMAESSPRRRGPLAEREGPPPGFAGALLPRSDASVRAASPAPMRALGRPRGLCGGLVGLTLVLAGCPPVSPGLPDPGEDLLPPIVGTPTIAAPCTGAPTSGRSLAVTTTDFATGALTIIDVNSATSTPDVALGSTDAKPFAFGDYLYLLHRFQIDALDVIDPAADWSLVEQQAIDVEGVVSANPQRIAFSDDGQAYITLFASPQVLVYDLSDPRHPIADGALDLRPVADEDGNPDASLAIVCDTTLVVSLQDLDPDTGFLPRRERGELALIDRESGRVYDLNAELEGIQGIPLLGSWARQWRLDPRDPEGHTLLALSEGVERIDLDTWTSSWLIEAESLEAIGITSYLQPQAFALTPTADALYLASYTEDFSEVVIDRFLLSKDPEAPAGPPERVLSGLQSNEQALEILAGTLWVGDRSPGASGLRGFDLGESADAPLEPLQDDALATGLAPYAITIVP